MGSQHFYRKFFPHNDPSIYPELTAKCRRLKNGPRLGPASPPDSEKANAIELLRDADQPFIFDIHFTKKSFTLEVYDTGYPERHWSLLQPDVIIIAFDISDRNTLNGMKRVCAVTLDIVRELVTNSIYSGGMIQYDTFNMASEKGFRS